MLQKGCVVTVSHDMVSLTCCGSSLPTKCSVLWRSAKYPHRDTGLALGENLAWRGVMQDAVYFTLAGLSSLGDFSLHILSIDGVRNRIIFRNQNICP